MPFDVETVSASDDLAAHFIESQLDAGEGPSWDAHRSQAPVLVPHLGEVSPVRWPIFGQAIAESGVRALYSFPLAIGSLRMGAVDLYAESADALSPNAIDLATDLVARSAADVLEHALRTRSLEPSDDSPFSRREVHQATGMVIAQLRIPPTEALLRIRAHAFASGRSVRETAADITSRRLTLEP
ncbi:GAF and ANTAR domain-containing protein [Microbacterium sp. H83]|uniref:GAF and ANTAR domain-containing protein n=1 Tax=Microbacterium sp. H83 TaxID=1827324 RepID=UPI0007F36528|nr:GAF and ANTAR domain-containing protein [Microbacterium sp. H83]OAN41382.1 hypothetical protein A4X16_11070 [Microbacterium sp. H83]